MSTVTGKTMRRALLATALGMVVSTGMTAAPATAADSWKTISTSKKCHTYSYGYSCLVTKTQLRQVSYCTKPPIKNPYASIYWSMYCLRTTTTTTYG